MPGLGPLSKHPAMGFLPQSRCAIWRSPLDHDGEQSDSFPNCFKSLWTRCFFGNRVASEEVTEGVI